MWPERIAGMALCGAAGATLHNSIIIGACLFIAGMALLHAEHAH
jgi:hypothetical protein